MDPVTLANAGLEATRHERFEDALPKFERNEVSGVVVGPLARIDFVPETVLVYGNSAQVLRLVNACLFARGGAMTAETTGRGPWLSTTIEPRIRLVLGGKGQRRSRWPLSDSIERPLMMIPTRLISATWSTWSITAWSCGGTSCPPVDQ